MKLSKRKKTSKTSLFQSSPFRKKERNSFSLKPTARIKSSRARIKVVGIGGGGGNAISRMMSGEKMKGVEFITINTDAQDLNYARSHRKLYIGRALTKGLGAGMNPEIGKQAAEESRSEIGEVLEGADIVFITAGFGGGTGTGGSPVVAEIAREKGILTIGIITKPFTFEGAQRMNIALEGISRFKDKVDALVVIPNDRIFNLINKDTSLSRAFGYIDDILKNAVQAIAEIINTPGIINVDFADIKTIMKDAGTALVGIGAASGPERGIKAVQAAINSPLLEISIDGAKGVLFSVAGGRDLKMAEINEIAKAISEKLDANAKIIFGAYHDGRIKDKQIKVTVIATGFNGLMVSRSQTPNLFFDQFLKNKRETSELISEKEKGEAEEEIVEPSLVQTKKEKKQPAWEVPTFLRKRRR